KLAAVIRFGRGKEQHRSQVAAHRRRRARYGDERIVVMRSIGLAALIAIEERRRHTERQSQSNNQWICRERVENHLANLTGGRMRERYFLIVLNLLRHDPSAGAAIDPFGTVEQSAAFRDLLWPQDGGDVIEHSVFSGKRRQCSKSRALSTQRVD